MAAIRTSFMSGEDERQYMIREDYEIYEKYGNYITGFNHVTFSSEL